MTLNQKWLIARHQMECFTKSSMNYYVYVRFLTFMINYTSLNPIYCHEGERTKRDLDILQITIKEKRVQKSIVLATPRNVCISSFMPIFLPCNMEIVISEPRIPVQYSCNLSMVLFTLF